MLAKIIDENGDEITAANPLHVTVSIDGATIMLPVDIQGHQLTDAEALPVKLTGSLTTVTHSAATCGVNTGAMLAANANRKYALIINDSDTTIYLKIGANAVLNAGIRLNANGGSYEICAANGNLALGAINGITTAAGKNVIVTEGV